jgi:hypothetical protein
MCQQSGGDVDVRQCGVCRQRATREVGGATLSTIPAFDNDVAHKAFDDGRPSTPL